MASGRITKRAVDALIATGEKQFLWDDELHGFALQVTPAGAKSYIFQYRVGGREAPKRRFTIGRHGSPWNPSSAREECSRLAVMVKQGVDPAAASRERRRQAVDLAFDSYVTTFTEGYLKSEWKDWTQAENLLRREPTAVLRNKALPAVTRADVIAVFDRLRDRPATARLAHALLRKLFRWAEGRGEIARGQSPLEGDFPAPKSVPARERVLSDRELAFAWNAATRLSYPFGPMYRLLIALGQRREEVAALDWAELDRKERVWTLPSARAKNGHANLVPLNQIALAALDEVALLNGAADGQNSIRWPIKGLVFTTTGTTPVSGHSRAKVQLDALMRKLEVESSPEIFPDSSELAPWRVHDLRRTVATGLQRLGARFEVTEAVLNHREKARGGIAGVYQRHDWKDEKRAALDAWEAFIQRIAGEKKAD